MKKIIEINKLKIERNGRVVLNIDQLEIKRGEILAVIGPNGAGKSTFLLALANLLKPASGEILYQDKILALWNDLEYRRKISFVFQSPLLLDMTVEENASLGLRLRGIKKAQANKQAGEWLKKLGVESLSKRRASQLSGGEAQRVALARALVLDPELLLLDEPFSALDSPTRTELIKDLAKLLKENQCTVVFVTHHLKDAAKLSHRISVFINGDLKQVGNTRQIKTKPADKNVASFLKELL